MKMLAKWEDEDCLYELWLVGLGVLLIREFEKKTGDIKAVVYKKI
jgi:hypothetical protein